MTLPLDQVLDLATGGLLELCGVLLLLVIAARVRAARASARRRELAASRRTSSSAPSWPSRPRGAEPGRDSAPGHQARRSRRVNSAGTSSVRTSRVSSSTPGPR